MIAEQRQLIEILAQAKAEREIALEQARRALENNTINTPEENVVHQAPFGFNLMAHPADQKKTVTPKANGDSASLFSQASTLTDPTEKAALVDQLVDEYTRLHRTLVDEVHSTEYRIEDESRSRFRVQIGLAHKQEIRHLSQNLSCETDYEKHLAKAKITTSEVTPMNHSIHAAAKNSVAPSQHAAGSSIRPPSEHPPSLADKSENLRPVTVYNPDEDKVHNKQPAYPAYGTLASLGTKYGKSPMSSIVNLMVIEREDRLLHSCSKACFHMKG